MPRKKLPTRRRPELLTRFIEITGVSASVSVGTIQVGRDTPEVSSMGALELGGVMNEPARDTREVQITLHAAEETKLGTNPIPWIGLVHGIKPVLRPAVFVAHRDFDRVWALAVSGLLKHMVLTEPRYQSDYVVSVAFSTYPEE